MKGKALLPLALAANAAPLILCFFYHGGAMLLYPLFAVIHVLLFVLNNSAARTRWQVVLLGGIHTAVTICTHQQVGWLYLHRVCDDSVGKAIINLGTWVGAAWAGSLSIASLVMLCRKQQMKSTQNPS